MDNVKGFVPERCPEMPAAGAICMALKSFRPTPFRAFTRYAHVHTTTLRVRVNIGYLSQTLTTIPHMDTLDIQSEELCQAQSCRLDKAGVSKATVVGLYPATVRARSHRKLPYNLEAP